MQNGVLVMAVSVAGVKFEKMEIFFHFSGSNI